jgi:hypothetical protein
MTETDSSNERNNQNLIFQCYLKNSVQKSSGFFTPTENAFRGLLLDITKECERQSAISFNVDTLSENPKTWQWSM